MFVYARAFIYRGCRNCVGNVNLIMPHGITVFGGTLLIASEGNDECEVMKWQLVTWVQVRRPTKL